MEQQTSVLLPNIGHLMLCLTDKALSGLQFIEEPISPPQSKLSLSHQIIFEIEQYFKDPSFQFTVPLDVNGTLFQRQVWNELLKIPAGRTLSYGELAKTLNTSARAIGNACRHNPIPIFIPCHRVVAQNDIGGYCGKMKGQKLRIKKQLLLHEAN